MLQLGISNFVYSSTNFLKKTDVWYVHIDRSKDK